MSPFDQIHCSCCTLRQKNPSLISHFEDAAPEKAGQAAHIDTKVLRANDPILDLLYQRVAINRKLNTFAPAVTLPPEVLTIIFEFACYSKDYDIFHANLCAKEDEEGWSLGEDPDDACAGTPLLIAKVCSVWRNVALSAPHLWTNIMIYYENERATRQAAMLQYWLSKSGQLPLDVEFQEQSRALVDSTAVIDVLVAHAHRIHTLNIFLPSAWLPALNRVADRMPLLTYLWVSTTEYEADFIENVNMFANAPQLRTVTLAHHSIVDFLLPWAQLESLYSRFDNETDLVETLRLCSRLQWCKAKLGRFRKSSTFLSPPMAHTALEELTIVDYDFDTWLFQTLKLPKLCSFVLQLDSLLRWTPELLQFLWHARETLETLSLSYVLTKEEELLKTLQAVPNLRKLVLVRNWIDGLKPKAITQKFLDLLNPTKHECLGREGTGHPDGQFNGNAAGILGLNERNGAHCLVPNLKEIEYEGEVDFTPHALVEFLVARWRGPSSHAEIDGPGMQTVNGLPPTRHHAPMAKLRSVKFKTPQLIRFNDSDAAIVRRLRREGMCLKFLKI